MLNNKNANISEYFNVCGIQTTMMCGAEMSTAAESSTVVVVKATRHIRSNTQKVVIVFSKIFLDLCKLKGGLTKHSLEKNVLQEKRLTGETFDPLRSCGQNVLQHKTINRQNDRTKRPPEETPGKQKTSQYSTPQETTLTIEVIYKFT